MIALLKACFFFNPCARAELHRIASAKARAKTVFGHLKAIAMPNLPSVVVTSGSDGSEIGKSQS